MANRSSSKSGKYVPVPEIIFDIGSCNEIFKGIEKHLLEIPGTYFSNQFDTGMFIYFAIISNSKPHSNKHPILRHSRFRLTTTYSIA